jgi:hypothetical protein
MAPNGLPSVVICCVLVIKRKQKMAEMVVIKEYEQTITAIGYSGRHACVLGIATDSVSK